MERLEALLLDALPQTQCTRCSYPDCASYARAMASGAAAINQCPPGGQEGIARLAALTGQPEVALNPANGLEGPRSVAFIDEDWCIGCTLCIDACPTDAIVGINKRMHTVIEPHCTGCALCLPVCPVDCIHLENASGDLSGWQAWSAPQAQYARSRYDYRSYRTNADAGVQSKSSDISSSGTPGLNKQASGITAAVASPSTAPSSVASTAAAPGSSQNERSALIDAVMARVRNRL